MQKKPSEKGVAGVSGPEWEQQDRTEPVVRSDCTVLLQKINQGIMQAAEG